MQPKQDKYKNKIKKQMLRQLAFTPTAQNSPL